MDLKLDQKALLLFLDMLELKDIPMHLSVLLSKEENHFK